MRHIARPRAQILHDTEFEEYCKQFARRVTLGGGGGTTNFRQINGPIDATLYPGNRYLRLRVPAQMNKAGRVYHLGTGE